MIIIISYMLESEYLFGEERISTQGFKAIYRY